MTVYVGTMQFYDNWKAYIAQNPDLALDTFKILLTTSGYTPDIANHQQLSDVTNEVSGSGYARQTLGSVNWSQVGGVASFKFADPVFTATGGNFTARRWVIYDDSSSGLVRPLMCVGLLDNSDADVTVTDGNTLTFNVNAAGLFTLS